MFDESDDRDHSISRQISDEPVKSSMSPKVLKRQPNVVLRSSSEMEADEQTSTWHNLPKDVWKTAAEVNNRN